jgi:hypothetical protein
MELGDGVSPPTFASSSSPSMMITLVSLALAFPHTFSEVRFVNFAALPSVHCHFTKFGSLDAALRFFPPRWSVLELSTA